MLILMLPYVLVWYFYIMLLCFKLPFPELLFYTFTNILQRTLKLANSRNTERVEHCIVSNSFLLGFTCKRADITIA